MQLAPTDRRKTLSIFSLVMINVIAVDSLRTLPFAAEYGFSLVFYYLAIGTLFFVPTALVSAELATGWPKTGGLYIWVREAFNYRIGFLTIWLQWIYNVVWFPTILAFVSTTIFYFFDPALAQNKAYLLPTILGIFYLATLLNIFGIRISSFVSIFCALVGTLIPMTMIIVLGFSWVIGPNVSQISFSLETFLPDLSSFQNLGFVTIILFGLVGMEMSAVHAGDVKNPQRDYPKALLYSAIIIFLSLMLSSLAIAIVIPQKDLSLVSGLLDAYKVFFDTYHMAWMEKVMAGMIIIGAIGSVSAWIIGPTRGLLIATQDSHKLKFLQKTNRWGAPQNILILQSVIFTALCSVFLLIPSINSSYWLLSALTAQLALMVYLFMFASVIVLRYKRPDVKRAYQIPGKSLGVWLVAGVGILTCLFAMFIGFTSPKKYSSDFPISFEMLLAIGIFLFCIPPLLLTIGHKDLAEHEVPLQDN